jgi:hypothetical protein
MNRSNSLGSQSNSLNDLARAVADHATLSARREASWLQQSPTSAEILRAHGQTAANFPTDAAILSGARLLGLFGRWLLGRLARIVARLGVRVCVAAVIPELRELDHRTI